MRAVWYNETGQANKVLTLGEVPTPEPRDYEVLVRVHASGVNPSDVKTRAGERGPLSFDQIIPHSDGAGIIEAVGRDVDQSRIGERVWIWNGAWRRAFGTCADYISLPSYQAVNLPENVSYAEGACLGVPASTAYHGLCSDGDIKGQNILVTGGAGSVGHYGIQFAKYYGATVITTVSSDEKARYARDAGADCVINYKDGDTAEHIMEITKGEGVDRILEVEFGGNLPVSQKVLKPNGIIATYGSMAVKRPELDFYPMMFNGMTIKMFLVYALSHNDRKNVIQGISEAMSSGEIRHVIADSFSLDNIVQAHEVVESGRAIGNVIIDIN